MENPPNWLLFLYFVHLLCFLSTLSLSLSLTFLSPFLTPPPFHPFFF
uniref:Uncharacterized protein n=1 Tax=Rhizophora mucronata TaxID=61149 RepID=A0A2P2N484_RHIMU